MFVFNLNSTTITSSNSLNSLINRLEKGDLVEKDILVRNMVSNLEIDAQKMVIYRYKSPFNFIFEPEFSTGSPVGERCRELIDAADEMTRRLYCVVDWLALHLEYNPKIKVIPKKDYPVLVDITF